MTLTRRYGRIGEVRIPLSVSSIAEVRFAGRSTFSMTYHFEAVDGVSVKGPAEYRRASGETARQD